MRFAEALEQGKTEFGTPDRVVKTRISCIFIFGEKVLKVYNHETTFFADLLNFEPRKAFYIEDFFYNNTAAPEIYLHLWGVQERDSAFTLVPPSAGEDFVIEMSKIDDSQTFTKLLNENKLSKEQIEAFVVSLVDTLATLTRERKEQLAPLYEQGLLSIMQGNAQSLHDWMISVPEVPKEMSDKVYTLLSKGLTEEAYFSDKGTPLCAAIDNNCDNLILLNGHPSFIDIMPPMVVWRLVDEYATLSRLIVDAEVLGGKDLGDAARAAYAKYQRSIPERVRVMHELRAASIQWPYRYMLKQEDLAQKFGVYAEAKIKELEQLLN